MALIARDLYDVIEATLGGAPDTRFNVQRIANEACEFVTGMHRWAFLQRPIVALGTTADQTYITLPDDFGTAESIAPTETITSSFNWVTLETLNKLRQNPVTVTQSYWNGAVNHRTDVSDKNGVPWPVLELWPTPGSTVADNFRLSYRARWNRVTGDSDVVEVPDYMHTLVRRACMLFAKGYEEDADDPMAMEGYSAVLMESPIAKAAKLRDGQQQRYRGRMQGGAVASMSTSRSHFLASQVAPPS